MHDQEKEKQERNISFFQQAAELPAPLQKRFLKQAGCAIAVLIFTFCLILVTHEVEYICGVLFALYLGYLAMAVVWDYNAKRITSAVMICVKAKRNSKQRATLLLREQSAPAMDPNAVHKFYAPAAKDELDMITEGTILQVYYNTKNSAELMAWEIIGNI